MKSVHELISHLRWAFDAAGEDHPEVTFENPTGIADELEALLALRPTPNPREVVFSDGDRYRVYNDVFQVLSVNAKWYKASRVNIADIPAYLDLVANPNEPLKSPLQAASVDALIAELRTRPDRRAALEIIALRNAVDVMDLRGLPR